MGRRRAYDDYDEDNPYYSDDNDYQEYEDSLIRRTEDDEDFDELDSDDEEDSVEFDEQTKSLIESIEDNDLDRVQQLVETTSVELDDVVLSHALTNCSDFNIFCYLLDESPKSHVFDDDSYDFDSLLRKFSSRCSKELLDSGYIVEVAERLLLHGGTYDGAPKRKLVKTLDNAERRRLAEVEQIASKIRDILDEADLDFSSTLAKRCVEDSSVYEVLLKKNNLTHDQLLNLLDKKQPSKKL